MTLEPPVHRYNDRGLSPVEFLIEVMHAQHLPMSVRLDAAKGAAPYVATTLNKKQLFVKIEGGMPMFTDGTLPNLRPRPGNGHG
jgi:hypothetical protein